MLLKDPPLWSRLLGPEYDPKKYALTPKTSEAEVIEIVRSEKRRVAKLEERARSAGNKPPVLSAEGFEAFMQSLEVVRGDNKL